MKNFTSTLKILIYASVGIVVGVLNGFFGGGGGMLVVPVLENILKLDTKKSHASALLVIFPLSVASIVAYICFGTFNFSGGILITVCECVGACVGAIILKKLNSNITAFIFAIIVLVAGIRLVI